MSWLRSLGVISLGFLVNGCASQVDKLWPLPPDVPAHTIIVSIDTIHAMIAFPVSQSRPDSRHPPLYEEWGYAEQAWYLEQRMGLGGVLQALFWESSGVVEVGLHEQLWSQRTPQPPAEQFTFRLSENSYVRLSHYLEASKADGAPILKVGGSEFYRATDSYHFFSQLSSLCRWGTSRGWAPDFYLLGLDPRDVCGSAPTGGTNGRVRRQLASRRSRWYLQASRLQPR